MDRKMDEVERRLGEEKFLGRASDVFTFKLSIPAVVLTIALAVYIIQAKNEFETKVAVLMKYEEYLVKLNTLSKLVPIFEKGLFDLKKQLVPIDERVVNLRRGMDTANDNLTNVEMRLHSISDTSSKLEVDLPIQQQKFTDITEKLQKTDTDISSILKDIDSVNNEANDIKSKLKIAFENQTSLTGLLNKTTAKAEYVNTTVSVVHTVMSEVNKHLPTLENMNKSAALIMSSYNLLPLMQRSLEENKVYVHEIQVVVNKTESRLNDLKESSVSVSKAVSLAVEKQTNIEKEVKLSNEDIGKLKQHISNTDENIKNRLTKLAEYLKISEGNILARTSQLDTDIFKTEVEIGSMVDKVDEYSGKLGQFNSNVRELEIDVRNLQSQNTGLFQPINVCVVLAFVLIAVLFYMTYYRYDNDGTHQRTESHSTPPFMPQQILAFVKFQFHRLQMQLSQKILNIKHQRPSSILDMIHRVPVLDNKVCVLSFYSESMKLHRQLVESALATSNLEVILHLIRRHEDILTIPPARYIFVFVDFNTRNVILENPQDLGNKKLVAVQAAQKLGADVFVTYAKDIESDQLRPGNLYDPELSAFTSHDVLKDLEKKQRCFSVYDTYNNTQKESIVRSISR